MQKAVPSNFRNTCISGEKGVKTHKRCFPNNMQHNIWNTKYCDLNLKPTLLKGIWEIVKRSFRFLTNNLKFEQPRRKCIN